MGVEEEWERRPHDVLPACADCGEPVEADYDGEMWHKSELERREKAYLASLEGPKPPPEPEPSYNELVKTLQPGQAVHLFGHPLPAKKL